MESCPVILLSVRCSLADVRPLADWPRFARSASLPQKTRFRGDQIDLGRAYWPIRHPLTPDPMRFCLPPLCGRLLIRRGAACRRNRRKKFVTRSEISPESSGTRSLKPGPVSRPLRLPRHRGEAFCARRDAGEPINRRSIRAMVDGRRSLLVKIRS